MDAKVNPRTIPQDALPPPLEAFRESQPNGQPKTYPGFGWEGYCADVAISTDSPDALRWCHDHGLINHDTKEFFGRPIRRLCEMRAPKCAKVLAKLGYPA